MVLAHTPDGHVAVAAREGHHMLFDIAELFAEPEAYVCVWRDGELFIEAIATPCATTR
jgi:hypothetical protein